MAAWLRRRRSPLRRMIGGRGSLTVSAAAPRSSSRARDLLRVAVQGGGDGGGGLVELLGDLGQRQADLAGDLLQRQRRSGGSAPGCGAGRRGARAAPPGWRPGPRSTCRSRCQGRTVCRRWAAASARGRTQASGSASRPTLSQWCRAATYASRTALREADEVAGQRERLQDEPAAGADVELVEFLGCWHDRSTLPAWHTRYGIRPWVEDGQAMSDELTVRLPARACPTGEPGPPAERHRRPGRRRGGRDHPGALHVAGADRLVPGRRRRARRHHRRAAGRRRRLADRATART